MLQGGDHTRRGPINRRSPNNDDAVALSLDQDLHQELDEISNQSHERVEGYERWCQRTEQH